MTYDIYTMIFYESQPPKTHLCHFRYINFPHLIGTSKKHGYLNPLLRVRHWVDESIARPSIASRLGDQMTWNPTFGPFLWMTTTTSTKTSARQTQSLLPSWKLTYPIRMEGKSSTWTQKSSRISFAGI